MYYACDEMISSTFDKNEVRRVVYFKLWHLFRTPDENFGILLEAAVMYDRRVAAILNEDDSTNEEILWKEISDEKSCLFPRLLFIITGITLLLLMQFHIHMDT